MFGTSSVLLSERHSCGIFLGISDFRIRIRLEIHFNIVFLFCVLAEDGRSGTFVIGNEEFRASLLDLPAVVESFKTYDDSALVKTADIGQV